MNAPTVYSFCNFKFRKKCLNWIHYIKAAGIYDFKIVCHDERLFSFLRADHEKHLINKEDYYFNLGTRTSPQRKRYWQLRKRIFRDLLKESTDCIFSDIDAIFLRSPFDAIEEWRLDHDLLFSKSVHGNAHPQNIRDKIGLTVCLGWWYARNTPQVLQLLEELINHHIRDDQHSFNNILFESRSVDYPAPSIKNSPNFISFTSRLPHSIKIGILPRRIVNRPCSQQAYKKAYVEHPAGGALKRFKLWYKGIK